MVISGERGRIVRWVSGTFRPPADKMSAAHSRQHEGAPGGGGGLRVKVVRQLVLAVRNMGSAVSRIHRACHMAPDLSAVAEEHSKGSPQSELP